MLPYFHHLQITYLLRLKQHLFNGICSQNICCGVLQALDLFILVFLFKEIATFNLISIIVIKTQYKSATENKANRKLNPKLSISEAAYN